MSATDAAALASEAFGAWQSVRCPSTGEPPSLVISDEFGLTGCNAKEYNPSGANANAILFREQQWPYPEAEDGAGLTSVSFDPTTGEIYDADIEINATLPLSTTDIVTPGHYDLLSILTHEAGHFLGLAHSTDPDAAMYPLYERGSDALRMLSDDDIAGICAIYPPGRKTPPCDFAPRGGFARECPLGVVRGTCSLSSAGTKRSASGWYLAGCAACIAWKKRRRRRRKKRCPTARLPKGPY